MSDRQTSIDIALCSDLDRHCDLDPNALRDSLRQSIDSAHIGIVPGLCDHPERVEEIVGRIPAKRLVLGLCQGEFGSQELQAAIRKSGLDPYAVELVGLRRGTGSPGELEEAVLRLEAAFARLQAFRGSRPEELRPRLLSEEGRVSRRSLFTLPPLTYEAVPSIDDESCLGQGKCGLCVATCPAQAIGPRDGVLTVDKSSCVACGHCVTRCPVGAIEYPGSSLGQYEAELEVLLTAENPTLVFVCQQTATVLDVVERGDGASPMLSVEVPCIGMVTPGWVFQALAGGARGALLVSCGERCRTGREAQVEGRADYVRQVLEGLGDDLAAGRVRKVPNERHHLERALRQIPSEGLGQPEKPRIKLTEPSASIEAILALAERDGRKQHLSLGHPSSPLGLVRFNEDTCTLCGTCVSVCPSDALSMTQEDDASTFSYEAARCIGCGKCAFYCPEAKYDTIAVDAITDMSELAAGSVALKRGAQERCRRCGRPVAPAAMLDRIEEMLGDEPAADELLKTLRGLCSDCRSLAG